MKNPVMIISKNAHMVLWYSVIVVNLSNVTKQILIKVAAHQYFKLFFMISAYINKINICKIKSVLNSLWEQNRLTKHHYQNDKK